MPLQLLSANDKSLLVAQDLYDAAVKNYELHRHYVIRRYKPSKRLWVLMSYDEIVQELKLLRRKEAILGYIPDKPTLGGAKWLTGPERDEDSVFELITVKKQSLKRLLDNLKSENPKSNSNNAEIKVFVEMRRNQLFIVLPNSKRCLVKYLRTGLAPHSFMQHLLSQPDTNISRGDVRMWEGCGDIYNLSDLARKSGFTRDLKRHFFPTCNEKTVKFSREVTLSNEEVALMVKQLSNK